MRYDKKIVFVVENEGKYDPEIGEYEDPVITKHKKLANVTDLGTDRSVALFGDIAQGAKVVRLLRPYLQKWDYVLIADEFGAIKKFKITTTRSLRAKNTFIVKEVAS